MITKYAVFGVRSIILPVGRVKVAVPALVIVKSGLTNVTQSVLLGPSTLRVALVRRLTLRSAMVVGSPKLSMWSCTLVRL